MRLESETRKRDTLERRFVHGKWEITRIYVHGSLHEIIVKRREEYRE
jgi:hypothetical protein